MKPVFAGEWRTRDGRILSIRDMTTEHITNCLRMLERALEQHQEAALTGLATFTPGSMAEYYARGEIDMLLLLTVEEAFPKYTELRAELMRRTSAAHDETRAGEKS